MKAFKGGWAGQTFALAASSEDGHKKSRIRRSKEERKAMVESFVKRYQRSNNGNFPSLNLAHKEVGGSFYTVREIVREIIQENRVLGPAKLSIDEENNSILVEEYPLESISTEHQTHVLSSVNLTTDYDHTSEDHCVYPDEKFRLKEDQATNDHSWAPGKDKKSIPLAVPIHDENTREQQSSSSVEQFCGSKTSHFEDEESINGREVIAQDEESGQPIPSDDLPIHHEDTSTEQLQSPVEELPGVGAPLSGSGEVASGSCQESLEHEETGEVIQVKSLVQESVVSQIDKAEESGVLECGTRHMKMDVVVETFPLRPLINGSNKSSGGPHDISIKLEQKTEEKELKSSGNGSIPRNDEALGTGEVLLLENNKEMMDERGGLVTPLKSSNGSTTQSHIIPNHSKISEPENTSLPVGVKFEKVPNGVHHEKLNGIENGGSLKQLFLVEATSNQNGFSVHESGSDNASSPTLDRINLETWEGRSSTKSAELKTNPLVAFFVSLVTGFVKFLTE